MAGYYRTEPFDDGPDELDDARADLDDLRADIAQLEDQLLGLEHDLTLVAEILRAGGATIWGPDLQFDVTVMEVDGLHLTEDQQAVVERLLLL